MYDENDKLITLLGKTSEEKTKVEYSNNKTLGRSSKLGKTIRKIIKENMCILLYYGSSKSFSRAKTGKIDMCTDVIIF